MYFDLLLHINLNEKLKIVNKMSIFIMQLIRAQTNENYRFHRRMMKKKNNSKELFSLRKPKRKKHVQIRVWRKKDHPKRNTDDIPSYLSFFYTFTVRCRNPNGKYGILRYNISISSSTTPKNILFNLFRDFFIFVIELVYGLLVHFSLV